MSYAPAYVCNMQGRERGSGISIAAVARTRESQYHTNLYPSWETERQKDHAGHEYMMRYRHNRGYQYRFTNPPQAILNARLDNIAIVPASLLGMKALWQTAANTLPKGGVLLCHTQQNTRQRRLLERIGEAFRQQGHAVMNLPNVTDPISALVEMIS